MENKRKLFCLFFGFFPNYEVWGIRHEVKNYLVSSFFNYILHETVSTSFVLTEIFFKLINLLVYLFLAALGLHCCSGFL